MLDTRRARRLVVFGGSFDPPHRAHVELPFHVAGALQADGVLFIPAGLPPHKARQVPPAEHRIAMLELALGDRPDAAIWRGEIDRPGPSYTVDTLAQLRRELGDGVDLRLLIGADMAAIFYQWREPGRILELAEPVVVMRPPVDPDMLLRTLPDDLADADRQAWAKRIVPAPLLDVDSTRLRAALAGGRFDDALVRDMIPPAVLEYIRRHRLYAR